MTSKSLITNKSLSRRHLLRGFGVGISLPMLDAMSPAVLRASQREQETVPRRAFAICNNLGLLGENFFPTTAGHDYEATDYLSHVSDFRDDYTVFSGVWHPDVDGGHPADNCFLTAAPHPGSGGFRNTISLDQYMAEQIGPQTRFPSMTLGVNVQQGQRSLSWTGGGVLIPCQESAADVYAQLFLQGSPQQVKRQVRKLQLGESIMDAVADQSSRLQSKLGKTDRGRLDQFFTAVRELEQRMVMSREWEGKPKPVPSSPAPLDPENPREYMEKVRLMYEMARLAMETDSSRVVTLLLDSVNSPVIDVEGIKITDGYHNLSHHGKSEQKLDQLRVIDQWHMKLLAEMFGKMSDVKEGSETMLDRTMILYGSNLGDANAHVTTNLPVLFAGGGFKHGQHLAFDKTNNYPLPNLFVSMLQRMGIEADHFASSTGTMRGLEMSSVS